jgi:hypothetical protein
MLPVKFPDKLRSGLGGCGSGQGYCAVPACRRFTRQDRSHRGRPSAAGKKSGGVTGDTPKPLSEAGPQQQPAGQAASGEKAADAATDAFSVQHSCQHENSAEQLSALCWPQMILNHMYLYCYAGPYNKLAAAQTPRAASPLITPPLKGDCHVLYSSKCLGSAQCRHLSRTFNESDERHST